MGKRGRTHVVCGFERTTGTRLCSQKVRVGGSAGWGVDFGRGWGFGLGVAGTGGTGCCKLVATGGRGALVRALVGVCGGVGDAGGESAGWFLDCSSALAHVNRRQQPCLGCLPSRQCFLAQLGSLSGCCGGLRRDMPNPGERRDLGIARCGQVVGTLVSDWRACRARRNTSVSVTPSCVARLASSSSSSEWRRKDFRREGTRPFLPTLGNHDNSRSPGIPRKASGSRFLRNRRTTETRSSGRCSAWVNKPGRFANNAGNNSKHRGWISPTQSTSATSMRRRCGLIV